VAFLKSLAPNVASAVTIAVPGEPTTRSADNAAQAAQQNGITTETAPDIVAALNKAASSGPGRILICGSLYLAGHVLAMNRAN
jgi:dihydrofolate synthase / folylpolyglutamate synthase